MNNQKTYTFHVHGMHCNACILVTESELSDLSYITDAKSSLKNHSVTVTGDFTNIDSSEKSLEQIAQELTVSLKPHGYSVEIEKQIHKKKWSDFKIAIPVAVLFAILFVLLQKAGLVNIIGGGKVTYGTVFIIGIVASLSSCMAVVGGLLLSMSANFDKKALEEHRKTNKRFKPQIMFHIGRIVSFFILGGVIGVIGSAFTLSTTATFILSVVIGLVMLILGINLLDTFTWAKKLQPSMPKFIARHAHSMNQVNHTLMPLLVGIATFFLPCGFTQSMQIYTLSTESFLTGGMTMLAFALGTLPVLALISFSSFSIQNSKKSGIFFKSAGLIVILFALFNLINSLVVIGVIPPIFNF